MFRKIASILLVLILTSCGQMLETEKPNASDMGQMNSAVSIETWPMRPVQDFEGLFLPLPEITEFYSMHGYIEVDYNYSVGAKHDPDNNGFSFGISRYAYAPDDPPEGFLYDSVCEKISTFTIEEILRDDDLRVEKVKTECGGRIWYFLKTGTLTLVIWPERRMPIERLAVIEEILKRAKYSPSVD